VKTPLSKYSSGKKLFRSGFSEIAIYVFIWLFIVAELVFVSNGRTVEFSKNFTRDGLKVLPIFILFIINIVWLIPLLLFEKRTKLYVGLVVMLSIIFVLIGEVLFTNTPQFSQEPPSRNEIFNNNPPPERNGWREPPKLDQPNDTFRKMEPPPLSMFGLGFFNQIILCLLIIGLSTAIKVTVKWYKDEQVRRDIEKDLLKSELTMLQNQVSPHFFMNTLNNIHALIDINSKTAQLSIVKLSKMMRYLLYESDQGTTTLEKEIIFINSFVDLMKLRIDESVNVSLSVPEKYDNVSLPPLLLMPFIENAFKYGISYQEESYINIILEQVGKFIIFRCNNRILTQNASNGLGKGIGLRNVKKRLDLLFGSAYSLIIDDSGKEFLVKLILPTNES